MPFMTRIPSDLARFGLRVELVPGWETRGSAAFAPACVVDHWTAGPRGTSGRPSLDVVVKGRAGLAGPLANIYLARDGTCVVVAAGRANHAGTGGFRGLVGNSAAYGIEAESGGDGDWTPAMLDAYPRLNAALLAGLGRDASWVCGHSEWAPDRKIDIRDIIATVRAGAAAVLANPNSARTSGGFLMALTEDQQLQLYMAVMEGNGATGRNNFAWLNDQMRAQFEDIRSMLRGGNDPKSGRNNFHWLAEQVVAAVGSIPESQVGVVEDAIAKAVADEIDRRERERLGDNAA